MPRAQFLVVLLVCAVGASGCATRADYERVRREQREMRARLADAQVAIGKVNRGLDTMQTNLGQGGGGPQLQELERRVSAIESRLGALELGALPREDVIAVGPTGEGPTPRTEAAVIGLRREAERARNENVPATYGAAVGLYREGQPVKAIEKFRQFIRSAGNSELADDAQYWIGEAYYNTQDYNRAIIELNEVLLKYPQGDRVPGALLALATSFADSGDKIDARLILQKLINDHPRTDEAGIGRTQLDALTE